MNLGRGEIENLEKDGSSDASEVEERDFMREHPLHTEEWTPEKEKLSFLERQRTKFSQSHR